MSKRHIGSLLPGPGIRSTTRVVVVRTDKHQSVARKAAQVLDEHRRHPHGASDGAVAFPQRIGGVEIDGVAHGRNRAHENESFDFLGTTIVANSCLWSNFARKIEERPILRNERIDSIETAEGTLELRRRGEKEFMILVGGNVLMTTCLTTSEIALATHSCEKMAAIKEPRVLIGGLGLGFTLRAALDVLPKAARVTVAELNPKVIEWCKGPAAAAAGSAALDPRVRFYEGDVTEHIREVAADPKLPRYDAVLWDLYLGPPARGGDTDPLYGNVSLRRTAAALKEGGIFAVWGETESPAFEKRLRHNGFRIERTRADGRGMRHAVYLAVKSPPQHRRP